MSEILGPLRAAAITAFIAGLGVLLLDPPSFSGLRDLLVLLVGAVAFVLVTAWATVALIGTTRCPSPSSGGSSTAARRSPRCRLPTSRRASSTCW